MPTAEQITFPFASLDFSGRDILGLGEIARKLGVSVDHLLNEVEHGALVGLDLKGAKASLRFVRIPIENYRAYVLTRMTGPFRREFIRDLSPHIKRELRREMIGASDRAELSEMMTEIKAALTSFSKTSSSNAYSRLQDNQSFPDVGIGAKTSATIGATSRGAR